MLIAFAIAALSAAGVDETRLFSQIAGKQTHLLVAQCRAADTRRVFAYLADGGALYAELTSIDAVALLANIEFDGDGERSFETNGGVETYARVGGRIDEMLKLPARFVRPSQLKAELVRSVGACR